ADRAHRRTTLELLLDRIDRLTMAEAAVLREYVLAEAAEADQLRDTARGQDQAMKAAAERLAAAEATIREIERDRDAAREELAAVRAYDRALSSAYSWPTPPHWPERPTTFDISGAFCGTCLAWVPGPLGKPHACPPPPATGRAEAETTGPRT
ncbi:hypothetical protein, partial [Streptomyces sp. NPDC058757]|uniref:hypothetical protein n=1 Tax=Streptomyces sp. NPDC058757 TaxID=3346626 RepID=UPI0036958B91